MSKDRKEVDGDKYDEYVLLYRQIPRLLDPDMKPYPGTYYGPPFGQPFDQCPFEYWLEIARRSIPP